MSPVCSQPPVRVAAESSGCFQYPFITVGPCMHSSPGVPSGTGLPSSSRTAIRLKGIDLPQEVSRLRSEASWWPRHSEVPWPQDSVWP